jgi:hypothetical protein
MRQVMDLDLWCRVMLRCRVGFVDRTLSAYLHHHGSMTTDNARFGRDWLDRVWLFEDLLAGGVVEPERTKLEQLRRAALRTAVKAQAGRVARRRFSGELGAYVRYRLSAAAGRAPALVPTLSERPVLISDQR